MGRPRTSSVQQQRRTLELLAAEHQGTPSARAIAFLLALKDAPRRSNQEIAKEIGVSRATVDRWWKVYREKGLDALLELRRRGETKRRLMSRTQFKRFELWLLSVHGCTVSQATEWIQHELGISYSRSGIRRLLQRLGCRPEASDKSSAIWISPNARERQMSSPRDSLIAFINSFPETCDMFEAIKALTDALHGLLPEVDRIVISVDTQSDLLEPKRYDPDLIAVQDASRTGTARARRRIAIRSSAPVGEDVLDDMRRRGYPLLEYHQPHFEDYHYRGGAYIGSVFLFQRREVPGVSAQSIATLNEIGPFLRYALANIVTRHHYVHPRERVFYDAVRQMSEDARLTLQERRVVHYRLLGYSYAKLAEELNITESAVTKHIRSVHAKTGTSGFAELVAKYITPPTLPE